MRSFRLSRLVAVTGLTLAALSFSLPALADEPTEAEIAQARQLGQQGQEAFEKGQYADSERAWLAATKLYSKAPTLSLGLARAAAKNGHPLLAQENYNKIIREWGNVAAPPPAFKDALDAARAEVGALSSRIANVVITVEGVQNPAVTIDGEEVKAITLGLRRPVEPGKHVVKATAAGFKPGETEFTVAEGGEQKVALTLEKAPDAPPPPAGGQGDYAASTDGKSGSSNKTLALVAFGVGGVGLAVGAITGLIAMGKRGDLKDQCPDNTCPNNLQSDVDSYKSMGLISTIGFIVGGVGAGAGAILWFTAPKETASAGTPKWATIKPAKGVQMTPYVGALSAGVTGSF